jgi:hypothetical protein
MARRQITTAVTLVVLCAILVIALVVGAKSLFAPVPGSGGSASPSACASKTVSAGKRIQSSQVQVSVFNGGDRSGLASSTLHALRKRGFKAGTTGNAPSDAKVRRVQVWSTKKNDVEATLVAHQFGPRLKVTFSDTDLGPGVDVIVGNRFHGLIEAKKSIKSPKTQDICLPADNTNATG